MSGLFDSMAVLWWSTVAPVSVQVCLLVAIVAVLDRLLPASTWPELRSGLWLLVMFRLMLPPALTGSFGPTEWLPASWPTDLLPVLPTPQLLTDGGSRTIRLGKLAVAFWGLGFATLISWGLLRRAHYLRQWRARAHASRSTDFDALLTQTALTVGLRRAPRVQLSPNVRSPFVTGLFRPTVFLPESFTHELSRKSLEHVLLHELTHIKRSDLWVSALCTVLHLTYWFHPLVWIAQRRLAELREQCCDRTVAQRLDGTVDDYRHTLLSLAERLLEQPAPSSRSRTLRSGILQFISPNDLLLARVRLLRQPVHDRAVVRRSVTAALIVVLLIASLPIARRAEAASVAVAELIERPPGCLQLRYLVLQRMAQEQRANPTEHPEGTR